jgi:hypothetical protein
VILAAHRLSSIARAERVLVLEDGKISEEGRYDVLVCLIFSIIIPNPFSCSLSHNVAGTALVLTFQSQREGSRFRQLMAAQLALEQTKVQQPFERSPASSPALLPGQSEADRKTLDERESERERVEVAEGVRG